MGTDAREKSSYLSIAGETHRVLPFASDFVYERYKIRIAIRFQKPEITDTNCKLSKIMPFVKLLALYATKGSQHALDGNTTRIYT